jgi:cytidylate kinase
MNRIITISREFGSGGRELGKRLAEALGVPCYDHEIIEMIARENGFDERYVANVSERSIEAAYPLTIGHRFAMTDFPIMDQPIQVAVAQRKILENFAEKGDCVIVGRCADVILHAYDPLRIFVCASLDSKVARCEARAPEGENLTRKEMEKQIHQIEKSRAQFREMYTDSKWGAKETYDLCINTSHREIKTLIPGLTEFVRCWFSAGRPPKAEQGGETR